MPNAVVIAQGRQYRVELEAQKEGLIFRPVGEITEDTNFGQILQTLQNHLSNAKQLYFDLSSVSRINSCGVREWILFLERIQNRIPTAFTMVNEFFVDQASVVPTLLGKRGTPVLQFHAPYRCTSCNRRVPRILKSHEVPIEEPKAPGSRCEKCGSALEFDAIEEEYFAFLRHALPLSD
jgi:anti-anti-sigma regulatory factor